MNKNKTDDRDASIMKKVKQLHTKRRKVTEPLTKQVLREAIQLSFWTDTILEVDPCLKKKDLNIRSHFVKVKRINHRLTLKSTSLGPDCFWMSTAIWRAESSNSETTSMSDAFSPLHKTRTINFMFTASRKY